MNKIVSTAFAIGTLGASAAFGQTAPGMSPPQQAVPAAIAGDSAPVPVTGANSFTEAQAKSRIQSMGYGDVSTLKQDDKSIWRGTATKDGKSVNIALDFHGDVVAQ